MLQDRILSPGLDFRLLPNVAFAQVVADQQHRNLKFDNDMHPTMP